MLMMNPARLLHSGFEGEKKNQRSEIQSSIFKCALIKKKKEKKNKEKLSSTDLSIITKAWMEAANNISFGFDL